MVSSADFIDDVSPQFRGPHVTFSFAKQVIFRDVLTVSQAKASENDRFLEYFRKRVRIPSGQPLMF